MSKIFKVQVMYYQHTPPDLLVEFWWSEERGLTCSKPRILDLLEMEGILVPTGQLVYPHDGKIFFDSLRYRYTGVARAQPPVEVTEQGGEPLQHPHHA